MMALGYSEQWDNVQYEFDNIVPSMIATHIRIIATSAFRDNPGRGYVIFF